MPVKILPLPLQFLPVCIKSNSILGSSRVVPVFTHKLKHHHTISRPNLHKYMVQTGSQFGSHQSGFRKFSARSGQEIQPSKSLIEDEAELSDWVSGLSSNKTRVYSDSDREGDSNGGRYKSRGGEFDSSRGRGGSSRGRGGRGRGGSSFDDGRRNESNSNSRFSRNDSDSNSRFSRNDSDSTSRFSRNDSDSSSRFSRGGGREFPSRGDDKSNKEDSFFSRGSGSDSRGRGNGSGMRGGRGGGRGQFSRENDGRSERRLEGQNGRGGGQFSRGNDFDSGKKFSRENDGRSERRFEVQNGRGGGQFSRGNDFDSGKKFSRGNDFDSGKKFSRENDGRSEKRSEVRSGRGGSTFGGRLDGKINRDDNLFSRERTGKRSEVFGGLGLKREGGETGRRSMVITTDEEDETTEDGEDEVTDDEDEEMEKGYKSVKDLVDSDEGDEDDDDDVADDEDDDEESDGAIDEGGGVLAQLRQSSTGKSSDSYLSESRFDQCSVSPLSLKAIKDAGYEKMTLVQEATLPVILKGKDVMAKARTGTGKTVAFLLPAIELVVRSSPIGRDEKRPPISVLVICPTRELATQAAAEANKLLKYHPSIGVQVVIGGTRLPQEQKRMQANPCQILVATPGRLRDHVENTAGFATRLMGVKVLVLDEADHLLDMGFRKEIEKIIAAVPKQRQTLLFSATIPQEVRQICHIALKRDHEFINTVEEGSEDTHSQVKQTHLVAPLDKHFSILYTLLKEHIADDVNYKVLVFCTTAMVTRLVAQLLGELNLNVREIHSRKPQSYRTRISDEFRKSTGLILVTSDVSARGVDYPDVTLVVQIGVPADRQQYIHRLGRTGRKGKEGEGILMLAPWEEYFLSSIKDLPISKANEPLVDPEARKKVERGLSLVEMKNKEAAYQAWLGYYNSNKNVGRDKHKLVELANEFSRSMGLDNPPAIPKLVLGKMGLKNVPGLRSK